MQDTNKHHIHSDGKHYYRGSKETFQNRKS